MVIPQVTDDGDHLAGTDSPWLEATEDAFYQFGGSEPPENNDPSGGSTDGSSDSGSASDDSGSVSEDSGSASENVNDWFGGSSGGTDTGGSDSGGSDSDGSGFGTIGWAEETTGVDVDHDGDTGGSNTDSDPDPNPDSTTGGSETGSDDSGPYGQDRSPGFYNSSQGSTQEDQQTQDSQQGPPDWLPAVLRSGQSDQSGMSQQTLAIVAVAVIGGLYVVGGE